MTMEVFADLNEAWIPDSDILKAASTGPKLGPNAERFANHLSEGIENFGCDFSDFDPAIGDHQDLGIGLVVNQIRINGDELSDEPEDVQLRADHTDYMIFAAEDGIHYPAVEHAGMIPFSAESDGDIPPQTPERTALLFLASMVCQHPIPAQMCSICVEEHHGH